MVRQSSKVAANSSEQLAMYSHTSARICTKHLSDKKTRGRPCGATRLRTPPCLNRGSPGARKTDLGAGIEVINVTRERSSLRREAFLYTSILSEQNGDIRNSRCYGVTKKSESLVVCDVAEDLVEKLRKFRFRKETNNAAIIMKIDKDKQLVVLDEEHEGISPDELKDELPERQPRFIVYSYKYQHDDGRVSYPLCFIFSSPVGCKPEQQMMYAGSKNKLVQTAELTKVFEIRNTEDLTEEWLREKLGFFH
ncbi:PREDICTED: glia maturation factor beta [Pygoscelis adeliae]|uniref:glia maturation factor beta n=3 Tax=Neoaves TaxID=3078114 RepID=UPI0004F4FBE2|nr:PREDICTED: glia maturation factor beta [Pygoscelis adeliae]